ncbi:uncharacterized protein LOC127855786 isoform X3 [Dreissena polymorpha]|uniref:uncharacterized protein LOC127855786 isoform X3 n=1 Tax=Dreissena polymorpha TaxID=45954 RepID=UPI002264EDB0|nr:uncharacterized protein LOC127855786 isoform X3 [Dreissena polymorpha]
MDNSGELNVLEDLKNKLDSELDTAQRYQMLRLMKHHLGSQYYEIMDEQWMPRDLLECLENNMPTSQVLTILSHVFGEMQLHNTTSYKPFTDYISKYFMAKGCFNRVDMIGRTKELADVERELEKRRGVCVYGQGGLGKTTLINEVCTRWTYMKKSVKKVNLKETNSMRTMLALIFKQFNESFIEDEGDDVNLETVAVCLIEACKDDAGNTMLFLDNVENVYDNERQPFQSTMSSLLRNNNKIKWIMTSRLPLENIEGDLRHYQLGPMPPKDAEKLLEMSCKPKSLPEVYKMAVLDKCGNVPLAIKTVAVALVNDLSTDNDIKLSVSELEHRVRLLLHGTFECIGYAFNKLSTSLQHSLRMLSVVGTIPIDLECIETILNLSPEPLNRLMSELVLRQFLQPEAPAVGDLLFDRKCVRYSLHPLIVQFFNKWLHKNTFKPELMMNANKRFCMYIQCKIKKLIGQFDKNYTQSVTAVQENSELFHKFLEIVPLLDIKDSKHYEEEGAREALGQVADCVKMSPNDRSRFYEKFSKSFLAVNDYSSYCYWRLEAMKAFLIAKDLSEASRVLDDIETKLQLLSNHEMQKNITVNILFQKSRLLRLKDIPINETKVIEILDKSLEMSKQLEIQDPNMAVLISNIENLKGNVCFDVHKYDEAYFHHRKAVHILRQYIKDKDHPYITVYEFNIGTVILQKAETLLQDELFIPEEIKTYYLEALDIFNKAIERDRNMGRHYRPQFEAKLSYRAKALERLSRYKDALDDRNEAIHLVKNHFDVHTVLTDAYFMKAQTLHKWILKIQLDEENRKQQKAYMNTLRDVHGLVLDGAPLSEHHKSKFLDMYRSFAKKMPVTEKSKVEDFCNVGKLYVY